LSVGLGIVLSATSKPRSVISIVPFENLTQDIMLDSLCREITSLFCAKLKYNSNLYVYGCETKFRASDTAGDYGGTGKRQSQFQIRGQISRLGTYFEAACQIIDMEDQSITASESIIFSSPISLYEGLNKMIEKILNNFGYEFEIYTNNPFVFRLIQSKSFSGDQTFEEWSNERGSHETKSYLSLKGDTILVFNPDDVEIFFPIIK